MMDSTERLDLISDISLAEHKCKALAARIASQSKQFEDDQLTIGGLTAEVERLNKKLDEYEEKHPLYFFSEARKRHLDSIRELTADNERLRGLIEQIGKVCEQFYSYSHSPNETNRSYVYGITDAYRNIYDNLGVRAELEAKPDDTCLGCDEFEEQLDTECMLRENGLPCKLEAKPHRPDTWPACQFDAVTCEPDKCKHTECEFKEKP